VDGVDAVVHAATWFGHDVTAAETLLAAARYAQVPHLVYISIVGIDGVPFGYYRDKLQVERLIESDTVQWRRPAGGVRCCRCGCPAASPARCARVA
jgi:pimeloyl-ACP methyl ester carboxylesterase